MRSNYFDEKISEFSRFMGRHLIVTWFLVLFLVTGAQDIQLSRISASHVIIYYPGKVGVAVATAYASTLDTICTADIGLFKAEMERKLNVRLCRDALEFSFVTGADSSFSPLWKDGTLCITVGNDLSEPRFRSALGAGIIEGILGRLRSNGAPRWLIYSAAAYESSEHRSYTPPPIESIRYFSDLDEQIESATSKSGLDDLNFYLGNTGKFCDAEFGKGSLVRLVPEFTYSNTFDSAVRHLFHQSAGSVQSEWHRFLQSLVR